MTTPSESVPTAVHVGDEEALLGIWLQERSPRTQRAYRAHIARLRAHVSKPLAEITRTDVQEYAAVLAAADLTPATRTRAFAAVKRLLTFAHETSYIPYNVGRGLLLPGAKGAPPSTARRMSSRWSRGSRTPARAAVRCAPIH